MVRGKGRADGTIEQYEISLKAIDASGLGAVSLHEMTPEHVERFLGWRRAHTWRTKVGAGRRAKAVPVKGKTASNAVLRRDFALIRSVCRRQVRFGHLDRNPCDLVDPPKRKQTAKRPFEKKEIVQLLAVCGPELRGIVLAGFYTGQGGGDIVRWTWNHLSFEKGREMLRVVRKKTGTAIEVALHPLLVAELKAIKERRAAATGKIPRATDTVFLSRHGRAYAEFPKDAWNGAIGRAGLSGRGLGPHSMRRTFDVLRGLRPELPRGSWPC